MKLPGSLFPVSHVSPPVGVCWCVKFLGGPLPSRLLVLVPANALRTMFRVWALAWGV